MPEPDIFARFTTALDEYSAAINSVAALGHAHKLHACQGSALPENIDAKLDDALRAARRAWNTIEPLIEPIAAALGFNSAEPVLAFRREFNPAAMIPADTGSVGVACALAPYLHTVTNKIKSLLERERICRADPVREDRSDFLMARNAGEFAVRLRRHVNAIVKLRRMVELKSSAPNYERASEARAAMTLAKQLGIGVAWMEIPDTMAWPALERIYNSIIDAAEAVGETVQTGDAENAKPDRVTGNAGSGNVNSVLHPDDVKILRALNSSAITQTQYALEEIARLSRRNISKRLAHLRSAGLTHRPQGERGGEAITDDGRAAIAAIATDELHAVR